CECLLVYRAAGKSFERRLRSKPNPQISSTNSSLVSGTTRDYFNAKRRLVEYLTNDSEIVKEIIPAPDFNTPMQVKVRITLHQIADVVQKLDTQIVLKHDGQISWLAPVHVKTECKINVKYFPFDEQICRVTFGSWTYHGFKVDLQSGHADITNFVKNTEWDLIEAYFTRFVKIYPCCDEPYPSITVNIRIRRRALFYLFNLVIPCGVIALLASLSFFLPSSNGERISLVVTVLLSLTVYMLIVSETMPPTSEVVPLIGKFYISTMVLIALTLVAPVVAVLSCCINNSQIMKILLSWRALHGQPLSKIFYQIARKTRQAWVRRSKLTGKTLKSYVCSSVAEQFQQRHELPCLLFSHRRSSEQQSSVFFHTKMCRLRVLNDAPMTMLEREFGGNYMDLHADVHSLFTKTASEAEVLSMYINGAEPYRKKKAITKIFRRSKYVPRLEDIEERAENCELENDDVRLASTLDLSLTCIHLERAISAGIMAQDSRRRRHKASSPSRGQDSPRRERRRSRRSAGEKASV
ncbi:neuronal acetylcholine receptor subunit alpha-10, partial [Paramuricea clavata]